MTNLSNPDRFSSYVPDVLNMALEMTDVFNRAVHMHRNEINRALGTKRKELGQPLTQIFISPHPHISPPT